MTHDEEKHIAFVATTRDQVVAFHDAAATIGAKVLHEPKVFTEYHENYFAAFVRDPDGNNIEAVCHTPAREIRRMGLNLNNVLVESNDPDSLAAFYTQVFGDPTWTLGDWTAWEVGDGFLTVGPHDTGVTTDPLRPGPVLIGFFADDVEAEVERIKNAGARVVHAPFHPVDDPEGWLAFLADPDGNHLQIMRPTLGPKTDRSAG